MELEPSRPVATFPPSLISPLCRIIFSLSLPLEPESSTLDPRPPPAGEEVARELLFSLALVSKEFYHAARPWLWRTLIIQVGEFLFLARFPPRLARASGREGQGHMVDKSGEGPRTWPRRKQ